MKYALILGKKSLVKSNLHYNIISGYLRVERILKVHFLGVERRLNWEAHIINNPILLMLNTTFETPVKYWMCHQYVGIQDYGDSCLE